MNTVKRVWNYLIEEPFLWIFLCFFQPRRLEREMGEYRFVQRISVIARLIIPMFLTSYPLALLIPVTFLLTHISSPMNLSTLLVLTFLGIAVGIAFYIAFGIAFGTAISITFGITGGITVGITVGITFGITDGIIGGIIGGISFIVGYYRFPLYVVSGLSALYTYIKSQRDQPSVFRYLRRSSLHWDERVYLPLPFLRRTLLLAVEKDEKQVIEEVIFIITERPLQTRAARAAALEIIVRDLETRKNLKEIGDAWPYLVSLLPLEARPSGPGWSHLVQYLSAISTDARRYGRPIGRQEQHKALADISENLRKAYPYVAFRDQKVTVRLRHIIEIWQNTVQQEQERLKHMPQIVGRIDNPYKPGQALNPHDESFVGRRDLAVMLSKELNRGSHRPTFLMNGERRMGKTSTLLQLPYLLGSHYIPVFYSLQSPAIYKSTAAFLGALGERIYKEMQAKGLQVEHLSPRMLRDQYGQIQDTYAYDVFDKWLGKIEERLEQEESTLLLNFDEFEKLAEAGEAKHIDLRLLLDWFRNIIQFHPRIALLFSGVHTFTEMGQETGVNWSGAFVNVQAIRVSFLKRDEAEKLVTKPTPNYPSEELFGEGVVKKIIDDTGCHPFLIQAICSALIDNLNAEQRQRAELTDVDNAIEQVLEGWDGYFGDLWIRTSEEQRVCLKALLTLKCADIVQIQQQCGMEENIARRTLKTLLRRDLIAQNGETYTIVAPIFCEWVARNI